MRLFNRLRKKNEGSGCNNKITYTLETNGSTNLHDDLSVDGFAYTLNHLNSKEWDFMTLKPSEPIQRSTFIQVGAPIAEKGLKMVVEIGFLNPSKIEMYRHYTDDKKEVLQILANYFEKQEIPDYKIWEDISDEMN